MNRATSSDILDRKHEEGQDAFLWVHDSGDVILWPDEHSSENNDGSHAVARWQVGPAAVSELIASGEVDEIA